MEGGSQKSSKSSKTTSDQPFKFCSFIKIQNSKDNNKILTI